MRRGHCTIARSGVIASAMKMRRIVHSPIWWIASLVGRGSSQPSENASHIHNAGQNSATKTASFSGEVRPL